jgi:hypothetical protein
LRSFDPDAFTPYLEEEMTTPLVTQLVRTATAGDEAPIFDMLTPACCADQLVRWLYPDPRQHLLHGPRFLKALGGGYRTVARTCTIANAEQIEQVY